MDSKLGPFGGVKGKLEGVWHGSYSFFDFTGYRELLAGDARRLHEGESPCSSSFSFPPSFFSHFALPSTR